MGKNIGLTDHVHDYLIRVGVREHPVLTRLRMTTAKLPMSMMQISADQGAFMQSLIRLSGARRSLEVGTFTGYSTLSVALALPADGQIIACDINEAWTTIAREHWAEANVGNKITLRLAPALETLEQLLASGQKDSFDFAFIDADKVNYERYFEYCLKLVRRGGCILIDNVLWGGSVAEPDSHDADTDAIRAFNEARMADERIDLSMLSIADGLSLAIKR